MDRARSKRARSLGRPDADAIASASVPDVRNARKTIRT